MELELGARLEVDVSLARPPARACRAVGVVEHHRGRAATAPLDGGDRASCVQLDPAAGDDVHAGRQHELHAVPDVPSTVIDARIEVHRAGAAEPATDRVGCGRDRATRPALAVGVVGQLWRRQLQERIADLDGTLVEREHRALGLAGAGDVDMRRIERGRPVHLEGTAAVVTGRVLWPRAAG